MSPALSLSAGASVARCLALSFREASSSSKRLASILLSADGSLGGASPQAGALGGLLIADLKLALEDIADLKLAPG
jgi:hypothetical protein